MYNDQNRSSKSVPYAQLIGLFAAGLLIGALAALAWFPGAQLPGVFDFNTTPEPVSTKHNQLVSTAVSVADQPAGSTVTVASVAVAAPGVWVAIGEYRDGDLAGILGAERVPGPKEGVVVDLLRQTVPGAEYAVVLYRDNGDGVFDQDTDSVYVDFDTGERVVAEFSTTN